MTLVDLHCHTAPLSACSNLQPRELVLLAVERGLDGICLSEHDRAWDEAELRALRAHSRIRIFSAVELTTDLGHILAFGLEEIRPEFAIFEVLGEYARNHGGLLYLAHPARDGLTRIPSSARDLLASVEVLNGSDSRLQNFAAEGFAARCALPGIGGSDCHSAREVGSAATRFAREPQTDADLLAMLRSGTYEAVPLLVAR